MKKICFKRAYKRICSRGFDLNNLSEKQNAIYIYQDALYIEAGPSAEDSLRKKEYFYAYCGQFKRATVKILRECKEEYLIVGKFNDFLHYYEPWSNIEQLENYQVLRKLFHGNVARVFRFPDEHRILDCLIENGFRYLSNLCLYMPKSNLLLRFECHSQLIVYTTNIEDTHKKLQQWIGKDFAMHVHTNEPANNTTN